MQSMLIKQAFIKNTMACMPCAFLKNIARLIKIDFSVTKIWYPDKNVTCTGIGRLNHHLPSNLTFSTN